MVDYSKWNSFDCSDSNYDENEDSLDDELLQFCDPNHQKFHQKLIKPLSKQQQQQLNKHVNNLEKSLTIQSQKLVKTKLIDQNQLCTKAFKQHQEFFRKNKNLKFDPKITINNIESIPLIHPIFFTDPKVFKPKEDENGQYFLWGLAGYYIYESFFTSISSPILLKRIDPPVQFINELAKKKHELIMMNRKSRFYY